MPTARPIPAPTKRPSGPQRALDKLGLLRPIDFALHLPIRYEDETRLVPIAGLADGASAQVEGVVRRAEVQMGSRRQLLVRIDDGTGELVLRFLHFYPSQQKALAAGRRLRVRGEVRAGFFGREMVHPVVRLVEPDAALPMALTPVYPASAQLPQAYLRKAVDANLARADLAEVLPPGFMPAGLPTLRDALLGLHRPPPGAALSALEDRSDPAWQRLKFEELLAQQLSQLAAKRERAAQRAPRFELRHGGLPARLLAALPFTLTRAQRRVVDEIAADLRRPAGGDGAGTGAVGGFSGFNAVGAVDAVGAAATVPMHRLLQGDVGSGKTIVAALAAAIVIDCGWQCALMAPTQILAEQHWNKLVGWLEPLGVTVAWLTGSQKGRRRERALAEVASGAASLVVGTHAVIEAQVRFARLGLAIVDEQHRFGVAQRLALRAKLRDHAGGTSIEPHTLMMSATPIPRTLAMTLFADLDISTIDELPPGRTPIVTKLFADTRREAVIARIRDAVGAGQQVYWVCPLIDTVDASDTAEAAGTAPRESLRPRGPALDLRNATATHAELSEALGGHAVGLLHGRLKTVEKAATMARFVAGEIAVLVATTVIEVGVDVPNASLMVVEHAERFGLSQLHQLRGRVGRGRTASACVLLYSAPLSPTAKERLKAMRETADGFEIARRDMEIRGPGEFLSARQSGAPLLRFADPLQDGAWVESARAAAPRLLEQHPAAAAAHVERWLGRRFDYLKA